jgi:hypothetical protein
MHRECDPPGSTNAPIYLLSGALSGLRAYEVPLGSRQFTDSVRLAHLFIPVWPTGIDLDVQDGCNALVRAAPGWGWRGAGIG